MGVIHLNLIGLISSTAGPNLIYDWSMPPATPQGRK